MFNIIAHFFASIASFLFPLFASYKALKTSDPAQLTPWLMYWSVLSCALLAESWTEFILVWIPFYSWIRLGFLLWLVLPSTQGARVLYETYLHPYLEDNELAIEDFIASAHDRLRAAGLKYLKEAIELVRTRLFNLPPSERHEDTSSPAAASAAPQGYTQALLARFSVPAARWAAGGGTAGSGAGAGAGAGASTGHDFYNLLAGAVSAAAGLSTPTKAGGDAASARTVIPGNIGGAQEKMTFIAAQREKLAFMLGALDREAAELQQKEEQSRRLGSMSLDGQGDRPSSGYSAGSGLSKSRSEVDFEKIDTPSEAEEDDDGSLRRRNQREEEGGNARAGWNLFGWAGASSPGQSQGQSTGYRQE
ncbi:TB2/DP1, HVA22 family-domain-containing protein [Astrocystis sublimbata]|nr:TB2/DP1, HVA22 family-domain-containing protein [Astrocystis sublimbata]